MRLIPLSSDTETRPTPAMREAIAAALVGDEQRREDPTVIALEERVAVLLGKEAALWMPTGTLCNIVAMRLHTRPGEVVVADARSHVIRAESGGPAVHSGVLFEPVDTERGVFGPEALEAALAKAGGLPPPWGSRASLVCVEQTHNFSGGSVWPLPTLQAMSEAARARGLALHMDGARLMNAAVATGVPAAAYAACMDSVWIDFTKGLGAPIGAVMAGSREFVERARAAKHLFGGAMRQAGIAAAGCLHALDHHVERLADDHAHARRLALGLAAMPDLRLMDAEPPTNIVYFAPVPGHRLDAAALARALLDRGVRLSVVQGWLRAVTHLDVSADDIEFALSATREVLAA